MVKCINRTINSNEVDEVFLLNNDKTEQLSFELSENCRLVTVGISRRPTYKDFFEFANREAKEGDIIIIANTDIYPEKGTRELIENIQPNECYALSRYDEDERGNKIFFDRWDSQDVWIFKAPITIRIDSDFFMGRSAYENAIAHRIQQAGYNIQNPSKTIQFNHIHNSNVRSYNPDDRVNKPYLLITPHFLGEAAKHHSIQ